MQYICSEVVCAFRGALRIATIPCFTLRILAEVSISYITFRDVQPAKKQGVNCKTETYCLGLKKQNKTKTINAAFVCDNVFFGGLYFSLWLQCCGLFAEKPGFAMCVGCGSQIHDQYILRVSPDLEWHAACLKCAECSQYLDETCTCFVRDGKTYCKRDYVR